MPKLLLDLMPSKGLNSGLFPSADPVAGAVWRDGRNVWFKELGVEMLLGRQKITSTVSGSPRAISQAFVEGVNRIYYEDGGNVYYWNGTAQVPMDNLSTSGSFWFEPYGNFLLATDNVTQPRLWKNGGAFVPIGTGFFKRAKIIKKMRDQVLVYNTDTYPSGVHWSEVSDPESWDPTPEGARAGFLPFRDLDSEIVAVADLGAAHAVYSRETMQILQWLGGDASFGHPTQGLQGIGAVGKNSVVAVDRYNFGIGKGGVFMTDGTASAYIDRPAVDTFLQERVNWTRGEEVIGYYDERLKMIVWSLPLLSGEKQGLGIDAARTLGAGDKQITFLDGRFTSADQRVVYDNPLLGMPDGLYFASVPGLLMNDFFLLSQLYSPDTSIYTMWDFLLVGGHLTPGGQVRFGFTNQPTMESIEWSAPKALENRIPVPLRESIYIAIEISHVFRLNITSLKLFGEPAGFVL